MCVFYVGTLCAGWFGLGWAHDDFFVARHMIMHYSCISTFISLFLVLFVDWCFSTCLSLSLLVCTWHLSAKLIRPETLFVPEHLLPTLLHFMSGSVMRRPVRTSQRTSRNVAFIRNAMLSYWISLIPLYPFLFTVRVGSLFVRSWWVILLWPYRSFTLICTDSIILYLVSLLPFEVFIL